MPGFIDLHIHPFLTNMNSMKLSVTEIEFVVESNGVADDIGRESVAFESVHLTCQYRPRWSTHWVYSGDTGNTLSQSRFSRDSSLASNTAYVYSEPMDYRGNEIMTAWWRSLFV